MTLPAPNLDDLRFQRDLVDEARKRIIHYCPEWTEYNLSDPGITLIELFAWMTEMMVYRLNRVPEANYIKFLEMLGLQLMPASSAHTELTFWLSASLPLTPGSVQTVLVPGGIEIRSELTDEEVLFTTDYDLEIVPPLLAHVRKDSEFNRNFHPRLGLETFYPFDRSRPQEGDTFYLGFDPQNNISGHILQLMFECDPTEAVGIRREDPPWVWEYLNQEGTWDEVKLSKLEGETDTTGGLNNESGQLVLYLPLKAQPATLYGLDAFWLRCRIERRNPLQGMYAESPRILNIEAYSLGATVPGKHAINVEEDNLGVSNGEPGQTFSLANSPILTLQEGETLEIEEAVNGDTVWVPWKQVDDFSHSNHFDRHFVLNMATGEVQFGPSVRQSDGTVIQYGRVPENARNIQFSRYRYGGGISGNLPAGSLRTMMTSLAYVSRVSNLVKATGGRDQETLDELKLRAQRELQAQHRAVTAQDYEQFTLKYSRSVERARCLMPGDLENGLAGTVSILVIPAVADALEAGIISSLHLDDQLRSELQRYLDKYRLLTTSLDLREPRYTGVKVKARIVPQDFVHPTDVTQRVSAELRRYLSPLPLDKQTPLLKVGEKWEGWEFGRDLFAAEVISLIQQVPSVKYVVDVEVSSRPVIPAEEESMFDDVPDVEWTPVEKVLQVPKDGLICSLDHEIETLSVQDMYQEAETA
jgi:predicted phage baseplate assembly protein